MHTRAVLKEPKTYELFDPKLVNQKRRILIDKFTGKAAVAHRLDQLEINYSQETLDRITAKVKMNSNSDPVSDFELLNYI